MNNEMNENTVEMQSMPDDAVQSMPDAAVQPVPDAEKQGVPDIDAQDPVVIRKKKKLGEYTEYGDPNKRPTWIRVICIVAVVLLIGLIIATLIAAIAGASKETIMALILCDGIIPIFVWVFLKITQKSLDRRKEAEKYYGKNQD